MNFMIRNKDDYNYVVIKVNKKYHIINLRMEDGIHAITLQQFE